jgi:hypothetical protein
MDAVKKFLKSLLNTAIYVMDQSFQVERASDRVSEVAERGRKAIYQEEDHTLRRVLSFAVGVGLGVGAGILFAPASGVESRSVLSDKVQDIGEKIRERFAATTESPATGTEPL